MSVDASSHEVLWVMAVVAIVVSVMMSVVMLMLALALLRCFKGRSFQNGIQIGCCSGLLVILALVRQQGLYPPVEAVSP